MKVRVELIMRFHKDVVDITEDDIRTALEEMTYFSEATALEHFEVIK